MVKINKDHLKKATNIEITPEFLNSRANLSLVRGYEKQKWIKFCEYFLARGYTMTLYEARRTVSKYITLSNPKLKKEKFKVRFSNHKPIRQREAAQSCDFFVGRTNFYVTTTKQAALAVREFFNDKEDKEYDNVNTRAA